MCTKSVIRISKVVELESHPKANMTIYSAKPAVHRLGGHRNLRTLLVAVGVCFVIGGQLQQSYRFQNLLQHHHDSEAYLYRVLGKNLETRVLQVSRRARSPFRTLMEQTSPAWQQHDRSGVSFRFHTNVKGPGRARNPTTDSEHNGSSLENRAGSESMEREVADAHKENREQLDTDPVAALGDDPPQFGKAQRPFETGQQAQGIGAPPIVGPAPPAVEGPRYKPQADWKGSHAAIQDASSRSVASRGDSRPVRQVEYHMDDPLVFYLRNGSSKLSQNVVIGSAYPVPEEGIVAFAVDEGLQRSSDRETQFSPNTLRCEYPNRSTFPMFVYSVPRGPQPSLSVWACRYQPFDTVKITSPDLHEIAALDPEKPFGYRASARYKRMAERAPHDQHVFLAEGNPTFTLQKSPDLGKTSICMRTVWNESYAMPSIERYITHYSELGVDHFFVYIEEGVEGDAFLKPLADAHPNITVVRQKASTILASIPRERFPKRDLITQRWAQHDCLWRARHHADWLLQQFDLDEFLVGTFDLKSHLRLVPSDVAVVHTSHYLIRRPFLLPRLQSGVKISSQPYWTAGKSIVRPDLVDNSWVHRPTTVRGATVHSNVLKLLHARESPYHNGTYMDELIDSWSIYPEESPIDMSVPEDRWWTRVPDRQSRQPDAMVAKNRLRVRSALESQPGTEKSALQQK